MLAISADDSSDTHACVSSACSLSIRDTAPWYPDIPNDELHLNESSFPRVPNALNYQPLTMILFGGLQGAHLWKLVGIQVWIVDIRRVYGVDFLYKSGSDGQEIHTFGRRGPFSDDEPRAFDPFDSSTDECVAFPIDGPGGEIIDGVDVIQPLKNASVNFSGFRVSEVPSHRLYQ